MSDQRYRITPHIWLQANKESVSVGNVLTGRRVLLERNQLSELDHFCHGAALDPGNPVHSRLRDADVVWCDPHKASVSPRTGAIDRAVTGFLSDRQSQGRSRLLKAHPLLQDRLELVRANVTEQIRSGRKLDVNQKLVVTKDFRVLIDHVNSYLEKELTSPDSALSFQKGFLPATVDRPLPREDYEQQPCMPETSQRRVEMAAKLLPDGGRGLILGDDDLLSLYWGNRLPQECDVFELDEALIEFLSPQLADQVSLRARDLTHGLPEEFCGKYDIVFTDPMYERTGMDLFLGCCSDALSNNPDARVLFTTRLDMIDDGEILEKRMAQVGLEIEKRFPDFSRYRLPDNYRRKLVKGFHGAGLSPQLIDGLAQIPYLYADMFWLKKT